MSLDATVRSCDVKLVQGSDGETKRVLINGQPVPGLLRARTSGGPRQPTVITLELHASSLVTEGAT